MAWCSWKGESQTVESHEWWDSSVGRAKDWKSLCPRFDSGSRHHFFCLFSKAKNMKPEKAFASWHAVPLHTPSGVLHAPQVRFTMPPFQMKQLPSSFHFAVASHFVPQWSICCSQIWSTSVLRRLYKEELLNKIYASPTDWLFCFGTVVRTRQYGDILFELLSRLL